jgi:cytochrome c-type biogenesis protein CcmH
MTQRLRRAAVPRLWLLSGATAALFLLACAALYLTLQSRVAPAALSAAGPAAAPGGAAQAMDSAVAGLEARLARGGGADSDWNLLAQAYEFEGRSAEAARARAHQLPDGYASSSPPSSAALLAAADQMNARELKPAAPAAQAAPAREGSQDAPTWAAIAEQRRAQHDDRGARDAFEQLVRLKAMTAQNWADYADVQASIAGGSLEGDAGASIDRALALDPLNAKALWLKASQAHDARRYEVALTWWRKLKSVLPPDAADQRVIDANISEDRQLAEHPAGAAAPGTGSVRISGTVSISGALAPRVPPGATLFIYAKAADAPGPPLAVVRAAPASWPVSFTLDDSMAMLPARRLSQFDRVIVEARISRSGQATPESGDLVTTSPVLRLHEGRKLTLVVDHEIS